MQTVTKSYEIIVVDDGSTDDTFERALASSDGSVKVVRNGLNQGKGLAFKTGVEYASGDYVVLSDADMEVNTAHIMLYMNALLVGDVIIASKRHPLATYRAPAMRKFLSAGFNILSSVLTGVWVSDTQTGLKAFKREHLKRIVRLVLVKRFAFDVEMLVLAKLLDLKIVEVPANISQGRGFSKRAILFMLIDLLGIAYRLRILKWYQKNLQMVSPQYDPLLRL